MELWRERKRVRTEREREEREYTFFHPQEAGLEPPSGMG